MSKLRKKTAVLAAGLSCLLAGLVVAQQVVPGQSERDRTAPPQVGERQNNSQLQPGASQQSRVGDGQRNSGGASQDVERFLANCLLGQNKCEVELGRLAQQKAENPQVKEFAQMMVEDHGQLITKLQPLAGQGGESRSQGSASQPGSTPSSNPGRANVNAPGVNVNVGAGQADSQGAGGGQAINQLIAIDKQIGERSTEMMRQELEQKQGVEFDKCYIGGQIAAHIHASAALDAISQQATGELRQLASQAKPKVDHHLQQAKQIAQQLEGQSGRSDARQTGALRDRNVRPASEQR